MRITRLARWLEANFREVPRPANMTPWRHRVENNAWLGLASEALTIADTTYPYFPEGMRMAGPMKASDEADDIIDREEAADLQREQEEFYERESGCGPDRRD